MKMLALGVRMLQPPRAVLSPPDRKLRGSKLQRVRRSTWQRAPQCAACGRVMTLREVELDHVTPVALGGSDVAANLQVLCHECHAAKSAAEGAARAGRRG